MKDLLDIEFYPRIESYNCDRCSDLPIGYSYVPYQQFEPPYSREKALRAGTVFPALNKPYGVYGKEFMQKDGVKIK